MRHVEPAIARLQTTGDDIVGQIVIGRGHVPDRDVAALVAVGEDPAILGAPFFVMSFVDGDVVRRNGLPESLGAPKK